MSNRIRQTEHAGAKNGGGYWGKGDEAKTLSKWIRRAQSRQLANSEASDFHGSEQDGLGLGSDEKTHEE